MVDVGGVVFGELCDVVIVYSSGCVVCYDFGVVGVFKIGDVGVWVVCIDKGMDILVKYVYEGFNVMLVKGMCSDCFEEEIVVVVEYIVDKS